MNKAVLHIPFLLQFKYKGDEDDIYKGTRQVLTTEGHLQQDAETTIISFTLEHPFSKVNIPVVHDLSSMEIDLDNLLTDRLIEIAEDDYLFKGTYVRFLETGGTETWDLAARIKGSLDKENIVAISCPPMQPLL
ncbi:MAG: hypothetical protein K2Q24_16250 [Chitinophagaceae bacterium]|jgi:hypothetical protein|nr:hypothetical protein [Chitinophagaceae bacterium]